MKLYYYDTEINENVMAEVLEDYQHLPEQRIRAIMQDMKDGHKIDIDDYPESERDEITDMLQYVKTEPLTKQAPKVEPSFADTTLAVSVASENQESLISQAMISPLGNHFLLKEDGGIEINRDNPPTIEEAHAAFYGLYNLSSLADYAKERSAWMIGDLIVACEQEFGENFNPSQMTEITERTYHTLYTTAAVARAFPPDKRNAELTYTHHKEVFYTKIDNKLKKQVLDLAKDLGMNVKQTRTTCELARDLGHAVLDKIEDKEEPAALKKELGIKDVTYLYQDEDNSWKTTRQKETAKPPSGKVVIDVTRMEVLEAGSRLAISKA